MVRFRSSTIKNTLAALTFAAAPFLPTGASAQTMTPDEHRQHILSAQVELQQADGSWRPLGTLADTVKLPEHGTMAIRFDDDMMHEMRPNYNDRSADIQYQRAVTGQGAPDILVNLTDISDTIEDILNSGPNPVQGPEEITYTTLIKHIEKDSDHYAVPVTFNQFIGGNAAAAQLPEDTIAAERPVDSTYQDTEEAGTQEAREDQDDLTGRVDDYLAGSEDDKPHNSYLGGGFALQHLEGVQGEPSDKEGWAGLIRLDGDTGEAYLVGVGTDADIEAARRASGSENQKDQYFSGRADIPLAGPLGLGIGASYERSIRSRTGTGDPQVLERQTTGQLDAGPMIQLGDHLRFIGGASAIKNTTEDGRAIRTDYDYGGHAGVALDGPVDGAVTYTRTPDAEFIRGDLFKNLQFYDDLGVLIGVSGRHDLSDDPLRADTDLRGYLGLGLEFGGENR